MAFASAAVPGPTIPSGAAPTALCSHRAARAFPSLLPVLRLDRIYVRGFEVASSQVHRGHPWSKLSDHLAVSADLKRS